MWIDNSQANKSKLRLVHQRLTLGPINRAHRTLAHLLRLIARPLMRAAPSSVVPLRSWAWLWQPTYSPAWQELFYAQQPDPYGFAKNPYEESKYNYTIKLLDGRTYDRALEIGCAEGVFTAMLAPLCRSLLAVEVSETAIERAMLRLQDMPHVTVSRAALPAEMPSGKFDLIVCSDVLYYFPRDVLVEMIPRFATALAPGGTLLALHYLGRFGQSTPGEQVHELLKAHLGLEPIHDETVSDVGPLSDGFRATVFRSRSSPAPLS